MLNRKSVTAEPAQEKTIFDKALDWETSRMQAIQKSEYRAWIVAFSAVCITGLTIIAIIFMMPLKESIPYVIRVDNATGVPDLVTAMTDKATTGDEIMDKYWLAQYVRAHETYDWYTLQRDYNTVGLLSSPSVGANYAQLFAGQDALDKKYGKTVRATIEIISIVPTSKNIGTVRFIKTIKRVDQDNSPGMITRWVATIVYEYQNTALLKESTRLINPFGFQVLSYRVDPEMVENAS